MKMVAFSGRVDSVNSGSGWWINYVGLASYFCHVGSFGEKSTNK